VDWDCFGDYGIDNNGLFISLSEAGFANASSDVNSLSNPWLKKIDIPEYLVKVRGITLGTVSGSEQSIGKIRQLWNPDIETMESAAVFYVCLLLNKPFICLRAISNFVELRDKGKWRIKEALDNLNTEVIKFISSRIEII
jgi:futalosine hydrolase